MKKTILHISVLLFLSGTLHSQMNVDGQILFGNEWIDYDNPYYKLKLSKDGIYRLTYEELVAAGIPVDQIQGDKYRIFYFGNEIPLRVSSDTLFTNGDYFEFYGKRNRGELDRYIYENPEERQLNPEYSLFSDTSAYYLTWNGTTNGRRYREIEPGLPDELPMKERFYIHEDEIIYSDFHLKPTRNGVDRIRYSSLDIGEGFGSVLQRTHQVEFHPNHIFQEGPAGEIYVRFGGNAVSHIIQFSYENNILETLSFFDYEVNEFKEQLAVDDLKSDMTFRVHGSSSSNDRTVLANARLSYPRTFDFLDSSHFIFHAEPELANKYYEISNFDVRGETPWIYDVTNSTAMQTIVTEDTVKFLIPSSQVKRKLILVNPFYGAKTVESIRPCSFTNYQNTTAEYIILSHSKLFEHSESGVNWVQEYADYRSSEEGGGFQTAVIDIQQLYDQFAYGVQHHSISIRNFIHYALTNWSSPAYVFIIGKGREYPFVRTQEDLLHPRNQTFFVPTFGSPGSDNILAASLEKSVPVIPIGRLAAQSPEDIRWYLEKIKLHENPLNNEQTIEDQLWKKEIIHLSGGDALIQDIIFNHLKEMAETIEVSQFGANVTTFRKTSSDPIQTATSQRIIGMINNGVSFITFFGHSAVGTFDFSLEEPGKYSNYGRYPMIISLGCHSGNIHTESFGISEDFVIEDSRGAIAFLASSGSAYINPQYISGRSFYSLASEAFFGESIGSIILETISERGDNDNIAVKTLNEQLTLHGDPAIKIQPKGGPDLTFNFGSVRTTPNIVSTSQDSFLLEFEVVNLGRAVSDSLDIQLKHTIPDGNLSEERIIRIMAPLYSAKVEVMLPVPGLNSIGKNRIELQLDLKNEINEQPIPAAESNNELVDDLGGKGFCFYILDNSARPVYPPEFSIVGKQDIQLKSSTNNALIEPQLYIFEMDTTELFNSPLLHRNETIQKGGLIQWDPEIVFEPSTVYYWRSSPDTNQTNTGYLWENSSFVFLPQEKEGWNQSHYYQFLKNTFNGLVLPASRTLQFDTSGYFISIHNKIYDPITPPGYQFNFETFAASVRPWDFMEEGIAIAVTDAITGEGWINSGGDYGSIVSNLFSSYRVFGFRTETPEQRKLVMDFIESVIPDGNHVYFWTVLKNPDSDFYPESWAADFDLYGKNIFTVLQQEGASLVTQLSDLGSVPYNLIYIKGEKVLGEDIAQTKDGVIKTEAFIPVLDNMGQLTSTRIGPAESWGKLVWDTDNNSPEDHISVDIFALDKHLNKTLLTEKFDGEEYDLTGVDASAYPYLELALNSVDSVNRTSPALNYWRVFYRELPDAALAPELTFQFHADTLQQGDDLLLEIAIENLTKTDMDSLLVKYSIVDSENNEQINYKRFRPLNAEDTIIFSISQPTESFTGLYQLILEINPDEDQPEKHSFNNFGIKEFFVIKDNKNPLLDVTFDGIHIMDGDIVAPNPAILIELRDENPYLPVDDISYFDISLEFPDGTIWNVPHTEPALKFTPAQEGEENKARLEFLPDLSEGKYRLMVQARDASGNFSGKNGYEIHFEVIERKSISQVLNYPNPFSTSTQFVFTVTGEIPEILTIRVMTLSGKIVREITKEELGNIHIGLNRTDFRWDGTDDFGAQLANGIYLYQVIAKTGSLEEYTSILNSYDQYFQEGFGKLVIMR